MVYYACKKLIVRGVYQLKVLLMKSLAVSKREKRLDLEEFFKPINVRNNQLIQIKKRIIQLLNELVENKNIYNEVVIISKSGEKKHGLIKNLTTSDITRRIKHIKLTEMLKKLEGRDTGDIEFVRQAIGHSKLESTSSYVENLTDEDRRLRMAKILSPEN